MRRYVPVAGIDPGLRNTAVVIAHVYPLENNLVDYFSYQLVQTKSRKTPKNKGFRNLEDVSEQVIAIKDFTKESCVIFGEVPAGGQDANSASALGMAMGILGSVATEQNKLIGVTPIDVKKAALGKNNGSKDEMISWAIKEAPDLDWPSRMLQGKYVPTKGKCEHIADAVGVIKAGLQTTEFEDWLCNHFPENS